MKPEQDSYPVFEANQVLTSGHLNDGFNYLDQQERLTRARLIGIGIACGLQVKPGSGATIELAKGCGVTSQGYLIVEPKALSLVAYRADYRIPDAVDYPTFKDASQQQYPLWELFPAGEPNTVELGSVTGFLDDKALLLFLELEQRGLRNCSPNNCDDKGSEVAATVRRLLIKREHLDAIIAVASTVGEGLGSSDLEELLLAQLALPDLRLPRFEFPATNEIPSDDVLAAFLNVFQARKLAQETGEALRAAYRAFKPLLYEDYPDEPFADFDARFGFLDQTPTPDSTTSEQARFLQYYYDLFDDLLRAYDEFRERATGLLCACCPPEDLFPRHLLLGLMPPLSQSQSQPEIYRNGFLASPAVAACAEQVKEVRLLFQRIVEMLGSFTENPKLFAGLAKLSEGVDQQVRITPSVLRGKPLAERAIPYYYQQDGQAPLYQLWSSDKTRRNRANQNLAYRAYEYRSEPPPFVLEPLSYDLEAYDFLRIEGHLGKQYETVLRTLLQLKQQYRLPIAVVALRTGAYDDRQTVDLSKESCRFQDLEALFDALREQMLSSLAEGVRYLYDIAIAGEDFPGDGLPGGTPKLALLNAYASNFRYAANSIGAWYEKYLGLFQSRPYIDVDQNAIDGSAVMRVYCELFAGTGEWPLPSRYYAHVVSVYYLSKLSEILPASLNALAYADFENKCQDLLGLIRFFRSDAASTIAQELQAFAPQEDLIDHFDQVLFSCPLGPVKSVHEEYVIRIGELKKKQFLVHFLEEHPGMEHKAGVPLGGTFVLVYHGAPVPTVAITPPPSNTASIGSITRSELRDAISRINSDQKLAANPDITLLLASLAGQSAGLALRLLPRGETVNPIITQAVSELDPGAIIADFYLPYLCCSDCSPVQFVIPRVPPNFTVTVACTNAEGYAQVTVAPKGGFPPYTVKVDDEYYHYLGEELLLNAGQHTLLIRDSESTESAPQTVSVAQHLSLSEPSFVCSEDGSTYQASLSITGGTPPYTVNGQAVEANTYTTDPISSGTAADLEVVDKHNCSAKSTFTHTCVKPCNFTVTVGCTDDEGFAQVTVAATGGIPPYSIRIDEQDYQPLQETLSLNSGDHSLSVRDIDGRESPTQTITIAQHLSLSEPSFLCSEDSSTYTATFTFSGGTPPFTANGQLIEGNLVYTTDPISSGTSGDVELVDGRGCSAKTTFTHSCVSPSNFTVTVGCTDDEGFAQVSVAATGGIPPYSIRIDEQDYQPLQETLSLNSGDHSLTVRDIDGRESPTQTVTIAQHLSLSEPSFLCSEDSSTYTATFAFSGGTPPFTANGQLIEGNLVYTTDPISSGSSGGVEVVDSRGCSAKFSFTHICKKPCDLPCAGISLRRGYRLWLPEPDPNRPYTEFGVEVPAFSFEFPQGSRVDFAEKVAEIIRVQDVSRLNEKFTELVDGWLAGINALIADVTGNADWLKLSYQPDLPGFLGTLWIEYFECLKFDFQFRTFFRRPEVFEQLEVVYAPLGTEVLSLSSDARSAIPAFDGIRIDKCNPETPSEGLCAGKLDLTLTIEASVDSPFAFLKVLAAGKDQPEAYLWEAQDGEPAMANGDSVTIRFALADSVEKMARVTAFTVEGCQVIKEQLISFKPT